LFSYSFLNLLLNPQGQTVTLLKIH